VPGGYEPGTLAFTPQMSGETNYPNSGPQHVPGALNFVDASLGKMVHELSAKGLLDSTRIIIAAKHGQSPIDPAQLHKIGHAVGTVLANNNIDVAQLTDDDVALVWLTNQSQTDVAVKALTNDPGKSQANVQTVLSGPALTAAYGNPLTNSRPPDLIVLPTQGTIYTKSGGKVAEHGGFAEPDTHVALLVAGGRESGGERSRYVADPVQTTQIAPTILSTLGLDPNALDAVRWEGTRGLPGLGG
jgi:arylsulfatase A-like enzyme